MALEHGVDTSQLLESVRHGRFHRRLVGAGFGARSFGNFLRCADAGNDVLALRVDEEFAVELALAGRGIAREGNACRRRLAEIAEHHGLYVDRGAPAFRHAVEAAIRNRARIHPRTEHGADRAPQLLLRILREVLAEFVLDALLVALDEFNPVVGREIGIERIALTLLVDVEQFLEVLMADAEHDVGIHRDEAAIAVEGKAPIAGLLRQRHHGLVVEAEIEHGVHHARHRGARAGAHRDQQRIVFVAENLAGDLADLRQRLDDLALQFFRILLLVGVVVGADFRRDGEARRHRKTEARHFGQTCALATQQVAHVRFAFGLAAAKRIDPFAFGAGRGSFGRSFRLRLCRDFGLYGLFHGLLRFGACARSFAFSHRSSLALGSLLKAPPRPQWQAHPNDYRIIPSPMMPTMIR